MRNLPGAKRRLSFPDDYGNVIRFPEDEICQSVSIRGYFVCGGSDAARVYMLCQGSVKLTMVSLTGKTVLARVIKAGQLLGMHCVISGVNHEASAETLEPCQVDFIRRDDFVNFVHEHSDASMSAIKQSSKDYLGACHQIRYLGLTSSATDKLASFILESAVFGRDTPEGIRFNLRLKQEEIAQVVGVTRETVARALRKLRDKKLITINGASVLIMNKPALEAMITAEITNEKGITTQNRAGSRSGITAD